MVHELIGIQNGRVDLSSVPDIRQELSVSFGSSRLANFEQDMSVGSHAYYFHRSILPSASSRNFWGFRHFAEGLCAIIPVAIFGPLPILDQLNFRYEAVHRGLS